MKKNKDKYKKVEETARGPDNKHKENSGWLKKQFDKVEQEIKDWPEWKKFG